MNSDDLIDQITKGIEYDKSQITVDSILEDLINTDTNISNLVNKSNEGQDKKLNINKEGEKKEDINKILNEVKSENHKESKDINIDDILKEDTNQILKEATNEEDIAQILKEKPKEIPNDLINEILNENKNEKEKEKEIQEKIKKEDIKEDKKEKEKEEKKQDIKKEEKKEKEIDLIKKEREEIMKKELELKIEVDIKRKQEEMLRKQEEEKMKKKKEEERKKLDIFFPQFPNPVDFVQYIEILWINTKISGEMRNFLLQNHRKKNIKFNTPISETNFFLDINRKIVDKNIKLIYSKKDYLITCTIKGEITIFSLKNQKGRFKLYPKNLQNKEITCLDVAGDLTDILCGYIDGTIALINIESGEAKYINNKLYKDSPVLEIKIEKKTKENNEIFFISSGEDKQVFYCSVKKKIFWKFNSNLIIRNNIPFYMIKFVRLLPKISNYRAFNKYVLLGCFDEIKLFCLEPTIKQIFSAKKPEYIKENLVPDAQIGIGRAPEVFTRFAKQEEKISLILIISWANIIYFYKLKVIDENISEEVNQIGYYISEFNILRTGFLNASIVYSLDQTYGIKILDTSKINQGKIAIENGLPVAPKNNFLAEIERNKHISEYISNEKKKLDFKGNEFEIYLYSIVENDCSLQILGKKEIYGFNLISWDTFLKNLQQNNDFLNLFSVAIDIYRGKITFFSHIPDDMYLKQKVGDFMKAIIPEYVHLTLKEKKSNIKDPKEEEKILQCINIVIEACIELEAVEFLLRIIEPLFEGKEYGDIFLDRFEPFILCDKIIKYILSSDIILNLIDLYNKKDKLEILSQLLLHINIVALDKPEIKAKLEEINLIIPLIYLYHNGKYQDYFAPLKKMFDYFNAKQDWNKQLINEEDNLINYSNAITNNLITLKKVQNSKEYNGHRILWYIKWCLTGKKFPDNSIKMQENLFNELVPKIAYWLLDEKVIEELLKFDPKNYFIIYKNILTIDSLYNKLALVFNDEKFKSLVLSSHKLEDKIFNVNGPIEIIDYIVEFCKKKDEHKIYFYLYDFIIGISKNNSINIKKELRIESVSYILKYYKQTIKKLNNQEVESLINIIKEFLKDERFNIEDYNHILKSSIDKIFDDIKLFLLEKVENYRGCLELYLDKDSNIRNREQQVYPWLNKIINKAKKDSSQYNDLLEAIKDNIYSLISISLNEFYYFTRQIFQNLRKEVIDKLEKEPNLQLDYIELIIQSLIKKDFDFDEEAEEIKNILILHVKLLCQLKQFDKIVPAFKSYPLYPVEECLSWCEISKAEEACIYLYMKEGSIEKAFDLSISKLDIIFNKISENIKLENNEEEIKNLINAFKKSLSHVKSTCEDNDKNVEDLWFKLLDILYNYQNESVKLIKKYENFSEKKKNSDILYQSISNDIKDLTEKMCSFVSVKRILEVVTDKNKISKFGEYKELIMKLLRIYNNSANILLSVKRLLTSLIFQTEHSFQEFNTKGDLINKNCSKCNKEFKNDKVYKFNCMHIFHKYCIIIKNTKLGKEGICPICQETENESLINVNNENSLIKQNKNIIDENNKEENVYFNKLNQKLDRYDNSFLEKNKIMIQKIFEE